MVSERIVVGEWVGHFIVPYLHRDIQTNGTKLFYNYIIFILLFFKLINISTSSLKGINKLK